ncbi:MAG: hypothetical protein L0H83_03485 [Salinisphaera sp.]|nr:hypothetical protein [Salinisphaera sp.]
MATVDKTADASLPVHAGARPQFMLENRIDFTATNAAASDVFQALPVQAGWFVQDVCVDVETADDGTATIDVGDGADTDGYLNDLDVTATGKTVSVLALTEAAPNTVTGYTAGKLYAADDTIDVLANNALDAAVIVVRALVTNYNGVI